MSFLGDNADLKEHLKGDGLPSQVTFKPQGFRDVIWCPYLNEPAIMHFKIDQPCCPNCENYEPSSHQFICHIVKPGRNPDA